MAQVIEEYTKEAINIIGQGVNDPHIHIFNDRAYLYASHDYSKDNTKFVMKDWWVWSSDDLLNWQHESTLKPEDIYIGKPMDACWATDAVEKNGKYFEGKGQWYFTYCEMAFSNNRFFRDFWISRVEYGNDGTILPVSIDSKCVG